jgi:hypothetical protein
VETLEVGALPALAEGLAGVARTEASPRNLKAGGEPLFMDSGYPATCATVGDMTRAEVRRLARLAAEERLRALHNELALIHRTFPELREAALPANPYTAGVRAAVAGVRPALEGAVVRHRPKISAAGRRRIGDAAKRRWAAWRALQETDTGAASVKKVAGKGRARKKK